MNDETQVNPYSKRSSDETITRVKVLLEVMADDFKEIKVDFKEIRKEIYGVEGFNGLKGKTKITEEKLANHISLTNIRWRETLWALGVILSVVGVLITTQISDSEAVQSLVKTFSFMNTEP